MALALRLNQQARDGDEEALVAAVRAGDDRAFEQLYACYRARIGSYILGMVGDHGRAEDIAQEVFIAALRRLRATSQPVIFKPWLYEIAKNACIDEYRRTRRAKEVPLEGDGEHDNVSALRALGPTPHAAVESKQRLDDLRGAFRGLSESHHRILVLRELEGLSYNQIGDRMGISKPVVESTLFRARRRLGEEFEELESGRRCVRVQEIVAEVSVRPVESLGLRDRRLLSRHLSHCEACLRQARAAGIDTPERETEERRLGKAATVAGILPVFGIRRGSSGSDALPGAGTHSAGSVAQSLQSMVPMLGPGGPMSGFGRMVTATAIVVAGAGGGIVVSATGSSSPPAVPSPLVRPAIAPSSTAGAAGSVSLGTLGSRFATRPAAAAPASGTTKAGAASHARVVGTVRGPQSAGVTPSSGSSATVGHSPARPTGAAATPPVAASAPSASSSAKAPVAVVDPTAALGSTSDLLKETVTGAGTVALGATTGLGPTAGLGTAPVMHAVGSISKAVRAEVHTPAGLIPHS